MTDNKVRFVMFKRPFEEVINSKNLVDIENAQSITKTSDYRIYPISRIDLMEDGYEHSEDSTLRKGEYIGSKWGGKCLRAPDIYFRCDELLQKNSIVLRNIFEGETYLNTGGADGFFILTDAKKINDQYYEITNRSKEGIKYGSPKFLVKNDYLKPLIKDMLKEDKRLEISASDAYILCVTDMPENVDKKTLEYIAWGEKVGFNKRSGTKRQQPWYKPAKQALRSGIVLMPRSYNDSYTIYYNPKGYTSLRFYRLHLKKPINIYAVLGILNSTYFGLLLEINGAGSLGLGALDVIMTGFLRAKIPSFYNHEKELEAAFKKIMNRDINSIFKESGIDPSHMIREQEPKPLLDRKELDNIVFDIIGLDDKERKDIYWSVCELAKQRFKKANSLKK